jgi:hypothetical protein
MGRTRLIVLAAFAATLIGFAHPKEARATTCTIPNTFTTGTTINAAPFNANFTALATCGNNIDNSNIGSAGIYASQIICSTVATCTFGATTAVTFTTSVNGLTFTATNPYGTGLNDALTFYSGTGTGTTKIGASSGPILVGVTPSAFYVDNGDITELLALDANGNIGLLGGLGTTTNVTAGTTVTAGTSVTAGTTVTARGAYVAPVVNASGAALASTTHTVATTISAVTTNTCATAVNCLLSPNSVTFTGNAVFASTPVCTATAVGSPIGLDESIVSTTGVSVVGYNISSSSITSGTAATIHILCTGA